MRQTIMKFTDKPRFNRLVRAWREGMKPAPLYADDLADTRSLYRRRWVACLDVALDIIKNSPDSSPKRAASCLTLGLNSLDERAATRQRILDKIAQINGAPESLR